MAVLGHDGAVPAAMSELVLALVDGDAGSGGDGHRRAGVLGDELELAAGQRVDRRGEEQVRLGAQRVCGHQLASVRQVPIQHTSPTNNLHTHPLNGPSSGTTRVSRYQKGKTNLDFTEARDNETQWHQLGRMQVCTSLQTDNHANTPPLSAHK